jgi:hypothetical protein
MVYVHDFKVIIWINGGTFLTIYANSCTSSQRLDRYGTWPYGAAM